jgi:heptosyltransferase III
MKKILVIRRDNIGDLVCTTPVFEAIKAWNPNVEIHALVNSYNAGVLQGNPDVSKVHIYEKLKHQNNLLGVPAAIFSRIRLLAKLRQTRFDYAIVAGAGFQPRAVGYLRWIRPTHGIGYVTADQPPSRILDQGLPTEAATGLHEVEAAFQLLTALGIHGPPGKVKVYPNKISTENLQNIDQRQLCIGVHISSRKPSQRWSTENFIEFIRYLRECHNAQVILFWSPGSEQNSKHPGDDGKAAAVLNRLNDPAVVPAPTSTLRDLIDQLTVPDMFVCSDGGAMHIAAGLDKPILCFFGDSDAAHWHPWGIPYELLQPASRKVSDISVKEAISGFEKLLVRVKHATLGNN